MPDINYVTVLDNRYAHYQQTSSCWSKEYIGTRIDTSKFSLLTTNRWLKENTSQLLLVIHPIHLYLTSVLKCQVPPPLRQPQCQLKQPQPHVIGKKGGHAFSSSFLRRCCCCKPTIVVVASGLLLQRKGVVQSKRSTQALPLYISKKFYILGT